MREPQPRKQSPRAPSMTLEEAVNRVQKLYDRERLHPTPTDVVAQHLGYKGANSGSALQTLASVRYFGLVERPKDGYLAVSKDYERFKFAPDEQQRRTLLIGFLRTPSLYADLLDRYENALPSDANLKFELIERGFNPAAADATLSSFRRSVEYADYYEGRQNISLASNSANEPYEDVVSNGDTNGEHSEQGIPRHPTEVSSASPESITTQYASFPPSASTDQTVDRIPVRLPGQRKAWLFIPTPFYAADKARIKAQIDLLLTQDEEDEL